DLTCNKCGRRVLSRRLVDERHVEVLLFEVTERLGELIRQIYLLVQPADHDREGERLRGCRGARGRVGGCAGTWRSRAATGGDDDRRDESECCEPTTHARTSCFL